MLKLHRKGNPLYPALFDSVRDEIDVRSRAILQQLEKEAQEPREAVPEAAKKHDTTVLPAFAEDTGKRRIPIVARA